MTDMNTNNDEKAKLKEELNDSAVNEPDEIDPKAKFLNGGKVDEGHVVVEVSSSDESFTGLGKEELMKYANDPFWKKVRVILFILFWVGWLGMLVAAIVIIVLAPRCPYRPEQKWYEKESVYQVYPKSFLDTTEDAGDAGAGIGDLKGIINKLDYFKSLGTKVLYINSFYESSGVDSNLDVVDHKAIDPKLGTMNEFTSLRKKTKAEMRIILDFIPNHTSKNHTWFVASQNGDAKYRDYYVWRNCTPSSLPNNWLSVYGGPAWTYDNKRGECYLHQFLPEEPDLNLNNDDVKEELEEIMKFWLAKGVDGFNVIGAQYLVEDASFQNEPSSGIGNTNEYVSLDHMYTTHQNGTLELIQRWRAVLDSYATKPGKERLLLVSLNGADENTTKMYYEHGGKAGANIVTEQMVNSETDTNNLPQEILKKIEMASEDSLHRRGWMFGNQDSSRLATVVTKAKVKAMLALQMLLPGTPFNYYGDEIAMVNGVVAFDQTKDPRGLKAGFANYMKYSRDPYRTPMMWTPQEKAGFTKFQPWLPITNPAASNVQSQEAVYTKHDELKEFKELTKLREKESIQWGKVNAGIIGDGVIWFTRKADGFAGYLVVMNLGSTPVTSKFYETANIPSKVKVVYHSDADNVDSIDLAKQAVFLDQNHVIVFQY